MIPRDHILCDWCSLELIQVLGRMECSKNLVAQSRCLGLSTHRISAFPRNHFGLEPPNCPNHPPHARRCPPRPSLPPSHAVCDAVCDVVTGWSAPVWSQRCGLQSQCATERERARAGAERVVVLVVVFWRGGWWLFQEGQRMSKVCLSRI